MERRTAIKNLIIIAGGIAILPSCSPGKEKASIELSKLDISADQEALLAEITETILPKTKTPGAKELGLHLFVLKMVDDCHESEEQQKFITGLTEIDALSKKKSGESFLKASAEQRGQVLQQIESRSEVSDALITFYDITKNRTIQGYLNSRYVMTELIPYELVPSRYNGFFPVNKV
jgi:hypothetical protein